MTVSKLIKSPTPVEQIQKINEIIDNLGQGGGSVLMTGGCTPDYSAVESLTLSTTNQYFEEDGFVYCGNTVNGVTNSTKVLYINDKEFKIVGSSATNNYGSVFLPVSQGDSYRVGSTSGLELKFYPRLDYDSLGNRYLGTLIKSLLPIEDPSLHLLDGAKLEYTGIYKNFIDSIGDLYESGEKKSKIEKIGNLVDNNGIISNFSVSNYGIIPVLNSKLALASSWEIGGKFNVPDFANVPSSGACIFANNFGASSNRSIYIIASTHSSIAVFLSESGGTTWDIADNEDDFNINNLTANTDYWYRLKYTGSSYILELSTDGITYSQTKTLNKSARIYSEDANLFLGDNHSGSMYFPGSIDLNACYVNIEGQRYWTGREVSWATSELKWQESISTYGSCGKFVYNPTTKTVRLPKVSDIIQGTSDVNALGDLTEAGVPNITTLNNPPRLVTTNIDSDPSTLHNGAIYWDNSNKNVTNVSTGSTSYAATMKFDASRSSSVYGKSDTVQPQTIKALYYMVVATGSREEVKLNFDAKADKDLVNTGFITNCITQIPQDIKVELNSDGSITLKAGSVVYIPNGYEQDGTTKKFDKVVITNDITHQAWAGNDKGMLFVKPSANQITVRILDEIFSDSSVSASYLNMGWYDTTNNKIKTTDDSGSTWSEGWAFPLCTVSANNIGFTSINSVFNGFGFIGSVLFALPGVTGLLPNGRNEDGTLNNIKYTVDTVRLREFSWDISGSGQYIALYSSGEILGSSAKNRPFYQQEETPPTYTNTYWYKPSENFTYDTFASETSWTKFPLAIIGKIVGDATGKISSLTTKTTVKPIDENDLHNAEAVVETYSNGNNWYRIWSDGWCEQGGISTGVADIQLLKPFSNTDYGVVVTRRAQSENIPFVRNITTSGFTIGWKVEGQPLDVNYVNCTWKAFGYIS